MAKQQIGGRRGKRPNFKLIKNATMNDLLDNLTEGTIWRYNQLAESGNPWRTVTRDAQPDLETTNGQMPSVLVWCKSKYAVHEAGFRVIEGRDIVVQR